MCEPTHSIVQFPTQDEQGNPTESRLEASIQAIKFSGIKKDKIGNWVHFSKLGYGHTESMATMNPESRGMLPPETRYETEWWVRTTKRDGFFNGPLFDKEEALKCAAAYANRVSIGNLTLLRRFLEVTIRKTLHNPSFYVHAFHGMLNSKGKDEFDKKIDKVIPTWKKTIKTDVDLVIKLILGFTRKRELLVPEWADDKELWRPNIVEVSIK